MIEGYGLCRSYAGAMQELCRSYAGDMQELCRSCAGAVQELCRSCAGAVQQSVAIKSPRSEQPCIYVVSDQWVNWVWLKGLKMKKFIQIFTICVKEFKVSNAFKLKDTNLVYLHLKRLFFMIFMSFSRFLRLNFKLNLFKNKQR